MKCLHFLLLGILEAVSSENLRGKTITVTSILNEPFLMLKDDPSFESVRKDRLSFGELYEGYSMDLLNVLAKEIGFYYIAQLSADGRYGGLNNGTWSGMVGEVVSGKADMVVADLSMTYQREKVVDFTYPFMFSGITILYKKSSKGVEQPLSDFDDLANQNEIEFGCVAGGSTYQFFKDSDMDIYQRIYQVLMTSSVMQNSNLDGVKALREGNGKMAWLMESPSAEYMAAKHCDLVQVGDTINIKGYGIALPSGSPYREELNLALLKLQQKGVLDRLRYKWFQERFEPHRDCLVNKSETHYMGEGLLFCTMFYLFLTTN